MVASGAHVFRAPDYRMSPLHDIAFLSQRVVLPFYKSREAGRKREYKLAPPVNGKSRKLCALFDFLRPELRDIFRALFLELFYVAPCGAEQLKGGYLALVVFL